MFPRSKNTLDEYT